MELKAKQIKKALECCQFRHIKKNCDECKYHRWIEPACRDLICQDALALITSQEQRIKELEQCLEHEHASFMETFGEYGEKCERLTEENERLKSVEFTCGFIKPHKVLECPIFEEIEKAKADTVRKMQERLKEKLFTVPTVYNSHFGRMVDQIANELIGETK